MSERTPAASPRALVVALASLVALNLCGWFAPHLSTRDARRIADGSVHGASPERTAFALHVLASQGEVFDVEFVERLLAGPDPRLVDYAMTHDASRGAAVDAQERWLAAHPDAVAPAFFFHHQVRRMLRADLAAYFAASR